MKKIYCFCFLCFFLNPLLYSQDSSERITRISNELTRIMKSQWEEKNAKIDKSFEVASRSEAIFETYVDIDKSALYTTLLKANSPSHQTFGDKSYNEIIINVAETHFSKALPDKEDKNRFTSILANITKSPIVSSIINSNPATSIASSVLNAASQFFETTKAGRKIKQIKTAFDEDKLNAFKSEVQPFVDYYDGLYIATMNFEQQRASLKREKDKLKSLIPGSLKKLKYALSLDPKANSSLQVQFSTKFPTNPQTTFEVYSQYIQDTRIVQALKVAEDIYSYDELLSNYQANYQKAIAALRDESKVVIEKAIKEIKKEKYDISKLEQMLTDLDSDNSDPIRESLKKFSTK